MFYLISKVLGYLLSPVLWLLLMFVWPLLTRRPVRLRRRLIIALIVSYLLLNPFLTDELMHLWERPLTSLDEQDVYEAAIVLGGNMVTYDAVADRYIFRQHTDRLLQAYSLYMQGKVRRIIISGGPGHPLRQHEREAAYLGEYLKGLGMPARDLLIDSLSRNTRENALETRQILNQNAITGRLLLVTSSAHMRRAEACFIKAGIQADTYPTDVITGERRKDIEHLLVPSLDSLIKWKILAHEAIGYLAYRVAGYA